ncbi:MAG: holo-[acyl-carrier-protein] synthase [Proteobacteria bacterium]|nr:MAG: holo-[acyl-carrier-protein] synthase [Pseudomonadota bacterium]
MNFIGHGIDLVACERIRVILEKEGSPFEARVFTPAEIAYCRRKKDPVPHFAARFAAKEAYGKAMGVGLGASGDLLEVEVVHDEKGAPHLRLAGRAKELLEAAGGRAVLSLSHDGAFATASVIIFGA